MPPPFNGGGICNNYGHWVSCHPGTFLIQFDQLVVQFPSRTPKSPPPTGPPSPFKS